ncbi:hypothetical protein IQ250_23765 [Pseudanabaenaceae cyanobacterium LEGE 13415]|nr:hypothetical protein [Pseudanabaenaceae cyanobacterium LEGE 13415]
MSNSKKIARFILFSAIATMIGIVGASVSSTGKNFNPSFWGGKSATTQMGQSAKRQFKYDKASLDLMLGKVFLYELHLARNIDDYTRMAVPNIVSDYRQKQKDFDALAGNFEQRVKECLAHQEFLSKLDASQSMNATDRVAVHNIEVEQSRCEDQFNRINSESYLLSTERENLQAVIHLLNQRGLPGAVIVQKIQEEYKSQEQKDPSQN